MIEHVFDDRKHGVECYPSAVERALQSFMGLPLTPVELADDFSWHGRVAGPDASGPGKAPGVEVSDAFARLLEEGASHLAAATAASAQQSRAAAVQARELAAFARLRPADLFDRPDDEVGAAAAASRAARPAALTDVSEWLSTRWRPPCGCLLAPPAICCPCRSLSTRGSRQRSPRWRRARSRGSTPG